MPDTKPKTLADLVKGAKNKEKQIKPLEKKQDEAIFTSYQDSVM